MLDQTAGAAAPVVDAPPVAADQATQAPGTTAEPGQQPQVGDQPDKPSRTFTQDELDTILQKRLAKESRRLERVARAEVERDYYKRLAEGDGGPEPRARTAERAPGEPKREDYNDYESYLDARADWRADQRAKDRQDKEKRETEARDHATRVQTIREKVLEPGVAKYGEDFEESVRSIDMTRTMADAILESESPVDLANHLANHPDEAKRIAKMLATQQVRELAKIESKLSEAPAPTKTPAPITPSGSNTQVRKELKDMEYDDFVAARRRSIAQRR